MLIEKASFYSERTGKVEAYEFKSQCLSLLLAEDDQKKEELFEAICRAVSKTEIKRFPLVNKCRLSVNVHELTLEISDGETELPHCESANEENSMSDLELQILLLKKLFLEESNPEQNPSLASPEGRLSIFARVSGVSEKANDIDKAIEVLAEKLSSYPFKEKTYKIEDLLNGLRKGQSLLADRLSKLEQERELASKNMEELRGLELALQNEECKKRRTEYFQLCLSTAELDGRIMKLQARLLHEAELKRELAALSDLADFPIGSARKVQELWTLRESRLGDCRRLKDELKNAEDELQKLEAEYESLPENLAQFSIEDSQELYGLSRNIQAAREDLEQISMDRDREMRKVKDSGIDFDSISLIRKSLLAFSPQDFERAKELAGDFKQQKEKLALLALNSQNTARQLKSLSDELTVFNIKSRRIRFVLSALSCISALIVAMVFLSGPTQSFEVFGTIFLTSFVLSLAALCLLPSLLTGMRKDFEAKEESLSKQQQEFDAEELELSKRASEIQRDAENLSRVYELAGSVELFKKLQQYDSISATLKQLDVLEQMLQSRENHLKKLLREGQTYLERVKRSPTIITPESLSGLASEILRFKEGLRELERRQSVSAHRRSELRFLEGEIQDLDSVLVDYFSRAKLGKSKDLKHNFDDFEQKVIQHKKWETISAELKRMSTDITSEIFEHDLATVVSKLQAKRTEAWSRMQDLIALYPDILSQTIEDSELGQLCLDESVDEEEEQSRIYIEMKARRDELKENIRNAIKNFDEFHSKTQHELEIMERELARIEHDKQALALSLSCLKRIAQETKTSWAEELCRISNELVSELEGALKKIEWNEKLEFIVFLNNQSEPVKENKIKSELNAGLCKQISWLTYLTLSACLSRRSELPLILDEPFSHLDDRRFAGCLTVLIKKILPQAQIIVLSSQPSRYRWFLETLAQEEREEIALLS